MSEHSSRHSPAVDEPLVDTRAEPDRDIRFKWIYIIGGALVIVTLVYAWLVWPLSKSFLADIEAGDPPASPIAEASVRTLPPGPRLQPDPPAEMEALRSWEEQVLTTYGWVDEATGVARIPIDRALELVLEEGLPTVPNPDPTAASSQE